MIRRSQNGYRVQSLWLKRFSIGPVHSMILRRGAPGEMLTDMANFLQTIEDCHQLYGFADRKIRGSNTTTSNHASGTAFDWNSATHGLAVKNSWTPEEKAKIQRQLTKYEGCIRWGENYHGRIDPMHFEINANLRTVQQVMRRLKKAHKLQK